MSNHDEPNAQACQSPIDRMVTEIIEAVTRYQRDVSDAPLRVIHEFTPYPYDPTHTGG